MRLLCRAECEIMIEKESQSSHQTNATSAADNRHWGELGFSTQLVSQSTRGGGRKNTLRNTNTYAAAPHQIIKTPALITFAMEQTVGALLPLFAVFVVVANPAPVWWGEISGPYLPWQSLSGWRSRLGAYRELRSTVAESRIEREKEKKKNKKNPQAGPCNYYKNVRFQLISEKKKKKKRIIYIRTTTEGEAHQQDEINLRLISFPHQKTRRCECTHRQLPAASLISCVPALPCLKLINITGYLGWRSAPALYQPLTSIYQQNKRQKKKINKEEKKKKPPNPIKQQQLQGGCWFYSHGWRGGAKSNCPPQAGTLQNQINKCSACFLRYRKPPARRNRLSKPHHHVPWGRAGAPGGARRDPTLLVPPSPSIAASLQPKK